MNMRQRAIAAAALSLSAAVAACSRGNDSEDLGASGGVSGVANQAGGAAGAPQGSGGSAGTATAGSGGTTAGGAGGSTGGSAPSDRPMYPTHPSGRGAMVPYVEYEAEDGETNAAVLGPTRTFGELAAEASGRRAVQLDATGEYVQIQNQHASNSIVVRYAIPDGGQDYWATLGVYVDGELRTRLNVTSRYSWTYGDHGNPDQNNPAVGRQHHFYDESHALIGDVPVGATVMVRKDAEDKAGYYAIDLIDMEQVPEALPQPTGFISLEQCGATANDDSDDSAAIQKCFDRAMGENRGIYVPPGVFLSTSKPLAAAGITIRGAGMWHSKIHGFHARFDCFGGNCEYYDFAVFGDTTQRDDDSPETAFGGNGSSGVVLDNIWMEHTKTGYWTGPNTKGLVIRNSRIRNLFADGVNLFSGANDCVIENNNARNTGDDAFAAWSPADGGASHDNVFRKNYVQVPWMANCFGLYGGYDNTLESNVCADVVQYPGILLSRQFGSHAFTGTTHIKSTTLLRAGGWAYDQPQGALKLHADQDTLQNVQVSDVEIIEPTFAGIHLQGTHVIDTVGFTNVKIVQPGTAGLHLNWGAKGAADATKVVVQSPANGGVIDDTAGAFTLLRHDGNEGW